MHRRGRAYAHLTLDEGVQSYTGPEPERNTAQPNRATTYFRTLSSGQRSTLSNGQSTYAFALSFSRRPPEPAGAMAGGLFRPDRQS